MYKQSPTYPFDIGQNQRHTTEAKRKREHYKDTKLKARARFYGDIFSRKYHREVDFLKHKEHWVNREVDAYLGRFPFSLSVRQSLLVLKIHKEKFLII